MSPRIGSDYAVEKLAVGSRHGENGYPNVVYDLDSTHAID